MTYLVSRRSQSLQSIAAEHPRLATAGVHFNSKLAVATDGKCLVGRTKFTSDEPENTTIRFESAKQKGKQRGLSPYNEAGANLVSIYGDVAEVVEDRFPDWERVVPKEAGSIRITLDASLLAELAKLLNPDVSKRNNPGMVQLQFSLEKGEVSGPINVRGQDADTFAILMPAKTDTEGESAYQAMVRIMGGK